MTTSRRQFLSGVALAAMERRRARAAPNLGDDQVIRSVAGIRPFRRGGPRIERLDAGGKVVVHNYGHGGAGFTLSWGSASLVAELLRGHPRGTEAAVLGSGVVGLTSARVLQENGFRVRIYARDFPPRTTSDVAGAEWSPDLVDRGGTPAQRARFERMLASSWHRFGSLVGAGWGVSRRTIYEADGVPSGLDDLPAGLLPPAQQIRSLPFAPGHSARAFQTLLIEAPIFLAALAAEVKRAGASLEPRTFGGASELAALREPVIVNCLGLGAGSVFADAAVIPIRGQLVHLRPQPLPYLLDHPAGYLVPRADALVVGGSFEEGIADPRPDPATCARILDANRRFFQSA